MALCRQGVYGTARIGGYQFVRERWLGGDADADDRPGAGGRDAQQPRAASAVPFWQKLAVGAGVGGAAAMLATPPDFLMVKTQGATGAGALRRGPFALARDVLATRGARGVFRGCAPTVARAGVLTAVEQAVYDEAKGHFAPKLGGPHNPLCHAAAALASGAATAVATCPLDVVKTRFMCAAPGAYRGPLACAAAVVRAEGLRGLYRGFLPYYCQIGPWSLVMFLAYEGFRKLGRRLDYATRNEPWIVD